MDRLVDMLDTFGSPRMALVGDFILDCYVYGDVERINPEAPVPVLRTVRRSANVGGAGNVAAAAAALGSVVSCIGVLGDDAGADELNRLLMAAGASTDGLIRLKDRPTSVKTRFVGLAQHRHAQQMLRVDDEAVSLLTDQTRVEIRAAAAERFSQADIVVIEDYNKGVLTEGCPEIIAGARAAGKPVVVDPACIADYTRYRGATVLKPNRYEASLASGVNIVDDATLELAGRKIMQITGAQAVIITLDKEGAFLCRSDGPCKRVPHRHPRNVYDVSGAGDETLAVLAVALACGCDYESAIELANVAGGLEVERFGFVPLTRQEIRDELQRMMGLRMSKLLQCKELASELSRRKRQGETVVFTNGCFDLLHMGHVRYLQQARRLGHCLVVAINSDDSVRRLKGPTRPVIQEGERAELLASLECIDYVIIFDEDTPIPLLEALRPDILAKGGTTPVVVGRELVEGYGGKVLTLDKVDGLSTTQIIERILSGREPG